MSSESISKLLFRNRCTNWFPLEEVLNLMPVPQECMKETKLDVISSRQIAIGQKQIVQGYRFFMYVWKDLAIIDVNADDKAQASFDLLRKLYNSEDIVNLEDIIAQTSDYPGVYTMCAIFGIVTEKKQKEFGKDYICLSAILAEIGTNFLYISHLAVNNVQYTQALFGRGGDGRSFNRRGLAKILVGMSQCLLRMTQNSNLIYCWELQNNTSQEKHSLWESLGFRSAREDESEWPLSLKSFIAEYTFDLHESLMQDDRRRAMKIDAPVLHYSIYGSSFNEETELLPSVICDLVEPPTEIHEARSSRNDEWTEKHWDMFMKGIPQVTVADEETDRSVFSNITVHSVNGEQFNEYLSDTPEIHGIDGNKEIDASYSEWDVVVDTLPPISVTDNENDHSVFSNVTDEVPVCEQSSEAASSQLTVTVVNSEQDKVTASSNISHRDSDAYEGNVIFAASSVCFQDVDGADESDGSSSENLSTTFSEIVDTEEDEELTIDTNVKLTRLQKLSDTHSIGKQCCGKIVLRRNEHSEDHSDTDEASDCSVSSNEDIINWNCCICKGSLGTIQTLRKCGKCKRVIHPNCGFLVEGNDKNPTSVCDRCVTNCKRFRLSHLDKNAMATLCLDEEEYAKECEEEAVNVIYNALVFNEWLQNVDQLKKKYSIREQELYYGKTPANDVRRIPRLLLEETLLFFFKDEVRRLNLSSRNDAWLTLRDETCRFISLHGRCFSNYEVFSRLHKCESREWLYMKYNTWNKRKPRRGEEYRLVDTLEERKQEGTAWISLSGTKEKVDVAMIPLYHLFKWEKQCDITADGSKPNELKQVILKAKRNCNEWVEIDAGSSWGFKGNSFNVRGRADILPRSYRIQPHGENSCIMNSLVNALHYINDIRGRDELLKMIPASIQHAEYSKFAKGRREFAAYIMNYNVRGYSVKLVKNYKIFEEKSFWPTLCILGGDDGSCNHAITVVEDYIFESNCAMALKLTKENLDWCCCADDASEVKFKCVPYAYKFQKLKPTPPLVMRGEQKNRIAIMAMIQTMEYIGDKEAVNQLDDMKRDHGDIKPSADCFSLIRQVMNRKPLKYQNTLVKDLISILLHGDGVYPMILLLNIKGTFHFGVICIVKSNIFNGKMSPIESITLENICVAIDPSFQYQPGVSVEVIKGYLFKKKKDLDLPEIAKKRKFYNLG